MLPPQKGGNILAQEITIMPAIYPSTMSLDQLTRRYVTDSWETDREMPSRGNEYEGNALARWGEIFYNIDPSAQIAQELDTLLYRVTFQLSSGIRITVKKPSSRRRDWHETLWEIHHTTLYMDTKRRNWSESSSWNNFKPLANVRPWARTAAAVADDIQRRVIDPALQDHATSLQKIEQINEGIRRQAHTAELVRQVLGDTKPSAMYPDQDVIYYGQSMTAKIRVNEGGSIEVTKLEFPDPETALEALETLFQKYGQSDP